MVDRDSRAFEDGYDAFYEGLELIENPYKMTTDQYGEWEAGWLSANDYAWRSEKVFD